MRVTHSLVKKMPKQSRPRERLEKDGEKSLSTHELLAILLRTGPKDSSAVELSLNLLAAFEDLYYLKTVSIEELMCVNGIGRTKAIEIRAAIELGSRIAAATQEKKGQVTSSHTIGKMLIKEMKDLQQEHVITLFLNTKNEIIKKETIFVGGLSQSVGVPTT